MFLLIIFSVLFALVIMFMMYCRMFALAQIMVDQVV